MPATAGVATPIIPYRILNTSGAQAAVRRLSEKLTQTFLPGTPVQLDVAGASGFLIACPAMTSVATAIIAGFSMEKGHNLAASGVAPVSQADVSEGAPVNQPSAIIIPGGAWPSDGTQGIVVADNMTHFVGLEGGSTTDADGTIAQADLGAIFGLTKDATTGYWYVDKDKTTAALGACVEIVGFIDPVGTLHGKVIFRVTLAAQQLNK